MLQICIQCDDSAVTHRLAAALRCLIPRGCTRVYVYDAQQDVDDAQRIKLHMQSYRLASFAIAFCSKLHRSSNIIGTITVEPLTINRQTPDNAAMLVAVKVGRVAKEEAMRAKEAPSILCLDRVQATCLDSVCTGRHCARMEAETNYQSMQPAIVNRYLFLGEGLQRKQRPCSYARLLLNSTLSPQVYSSGIKQMKEDWLSKAKLVFQFTRQFPCASDKVRFDCVAA